MIIFKIIRKIGKILRGGAGKKEIFLGVLCGVLIGFNPTVGLTLVFAILLALLLNANIGFTLLGAALGKVLSLALAVVSFHSGYFIIHNMGLEGIFTILINAPVTALMDLDVYAMTGGLFYALVIGSVFGIILEKIVTKTRKKMLDLEQHELVGKTLGKKITRFLLWLAFGKQKLSLEDMIAKQAPTFRKSGLILVGSVLVIGLVLEFFLLDVAVKSGLQSAISANTGAEVNIAKAHLSLAEGKLEIEGLQVTDPDKPTHNLIQIDTLAADVSVGDLLRRTYTIEKLTGSTLKRDAQRDKPGALYVKEKPAKEEKVEKEQPGKSLEEYFAKARDWKKYSDKAYEYLKKRKENGEAVAKGEKLKTTKETAVADAKKLGYLKAAADLVASRPAWTIRWAQIEDLQLSERYPSQVFMGSNISSHPELTGKATVLSVLDTPAAGADPLAKITLQFDNPAKHHRLIMNIADIDIGGAVEPAADFPFNINEGKVDLHVKGTFSANLLDIPFALLVHNLKADVEDGETVMGMDSATATEVFSSMEKLAIDGALSGSLLSPRVKIDYDKLSANIKDALVAAGKKELSKRANKEIDKAKDELKEQAGKELDKALQSEEAEEVKSKATDALKKLF